MAVVGYRNLSDIMRCAAALERSSYAHFELVICENGGTAAKEALSLNLPAAFPAGQPITVIEAPANLGYAGGVNVCLRHTPGADAWWVLNPDTQPERGALEAMVERLVSGDCDAISGPLCGEDGEVQSCGYAWRSWMARGVALQRGGRLDRIERAALERRLSFLSGASMMVGRRFLSTAGLMREDYFLYAEEVEWCLRAVGGGLRLGFCTEAVVIHHAGTTTGSAAAIAERRRLPIYFDERNKLLVTRDRFPRRFPVAVFCSLCLLVLRYARRGAWRQFGYGLQGWFAGLRGERGAPVWALGK